MLKTCPHFMRGRLRECYQTEMTERHRAKMESESRAKFEFGRSELFHQAEEFARGHWRAPVEAACWIRQHNPEFVQNAAKQCRESRCPGRDKNSQVLRWHQAILQELRARRQQEQVRPIPQKVLDRADC